MSKEVGKDISIVSRNSQSEVLLPSPPKCKGSFIYDTLRAICYHLQSSKNVKNTHGRVLGLEPLIKVRLLHGCFSRFSNCANNTKSRKACRIKFHSKRSGWVRVTYSYENKNIKHQVKSHRFNSVFFQFHGNFVNINQLPILSFLQTKCK